MRWRDLLDHCGYGGRWHSFRAFVVIDLKVGAFKPEYAGRLDFYCSVVNDRLRHETDALTIGMILCQTKDHVRAEYSLSGISSYQLTRILPERLQSVLPTVDQIEAELGKEFDQDQQPPNWIARSPHPA